MLFDHKMEFSCWTALQPYMILLFMCISVFPLSLIQLPRHLYFSLYWCSNYCMFSFMNTSTHFEYSSISFLFMYFVYRSAFAICKQQGVQAFFTNFYSRTLSYPFSQSCLKGWEKYNILDLTLLIFKIMKISGFLFSLRFSSFCIYSLKFWYTFYLFRMQVISLTFYLWAPYHRAFPSL